MFGIGLEWIESDGSDEKGKNESFKINWNNRLYAVKFKLEECQTVVVIHLALSDYMVLECG